MATTHCSSLTDAPRLRWMAGRATLMLDSSSTTMSTLEQQMASTRCGATTGDVAVGGETAVTRPARRNSRTADAPCDEHRYNARVQLMVRTTCPSTARQVMCRGRAASAPRATRRTTRLSWTVTVRVSARG